jgi:hypothetical protein
MIPMPLLLLETLSLWIKAKIIPCHQLSNRLFSNLDTTSGDYITLLFNLATAITSKSFFDKYPPCMICGTEHRDDVLWQEEAIKKKFGGLMPKKPPLISKVFQCAH